MKLCSYCQQELKSRGVKIWIGEQICDCDEAMEEDIPCEWCDEYDDLWECELG